MTIIKIKVKTATKEFVFNFSPKISAQNLFLEICKNIGIREIWYFGLCYHTNNGKNTIWIDDSRKKISAYKTWTDKLNLIVKYYPEDVTQDLIEPITIKHYFIQTRNDVLHEKIYCPPDTSLLLASYATQIKHGDYNEDIDISEEFLIPERVQKQYKLPKQEFIESVITLWKKLSGTYREDNMLEYLKLAQDLDQFGVHFFNIRNAKGSEVLLGVTPLGLSIYKLDDKLNPTIQFPWSEILKLDYSGKKFIIYPIDRKTKTFGFSVDDQLMNKMIFNIGVGSNKLYIQRRQQETFAIMQMREQAESQKKFLLMQREKLLKEKRERVVIEEKYRSRIKLLEDDVDSMHKQLHDSQDTIERLRLQLAEIESTKRSLEMKQMQLEEMMRELEQAKNMEAHERLALEEQIRGKQSEVLQVQQLVESKNAETMRLQEEMLEANKKFEEFQRQQLDQEARKEEERLRLEQLAKNAETNIPQLKQTNEQLMEQLKLLQSKLEKNRDERMETKEDKIHRENIKDGRDKYQTLNEIRKGNTTRRVDMFENI